MAVSVSVYTTCNVYYGCFPLTTTITAAATATADSVTTYCNAYACYSVTIPAATTTYCNAYGCFANGETVASSTTSTVVTTTSSTLVLTTRTSTSSTSTLPSYSSTPSPSSSPTGAAVVFSTTFSPSTSTPSPTTASATSTTPSTTLSTSTSAAPVVASTQVPASFRSSGTSTALASSSVTSSASASATALSISGSTTSATGTISSKDHTGGLSTTGKIVVGIVVPLVILPFLALFMFLFLRRRRRAQQESTQGPLTVAHEKLTEYYGAAAVVPLATSAKSAPPMQTNIDTSKAFPDAAYFARTNRAELPGTSGPPSYNSTTPHKSSVNMTSALPPTVIAGQSSSSEGKDPFATPSPTASNEGSMMSRREPEAAVAPIQTSTAAPALIPFIFPRKALPNETAIKSRPSMARVASHETFGTQLGDEDDGEEAEIGLATQASIVRVPSVGSANLLDSPRNSAETKHRRGNSTL